jgi:hypothetical protein
MGYIQCKVNVKIRDKNKTSEFLCVADTTSVLLMYHSAYQITEGIPK